MLVLSEAVLVIVIESDEPEDSPSCGVSDTQADCDYAYEHKKDT